MLHSSSCLRRSVKQAQPMSRIAHRMPLPAPIPRRTVASRSASIAAAPATMPSAVTLTDRALAHLTKLQSEQSGAAAAGASTPLLLRVGVRQGGCSGMSYHMDFTKDADLKPEDTIMEHGNNVKLVVDPKSLLYLFGMQLDFSDALIGGGFQFNNPNATDLCGCGKSFGV